MGKALRTEESDRPVTGAFWRSRGRLRARKSGGGDARGPTKPGPRPLLLGRDAPDVMPRMLCDARDAEGEEGIVTPEQPEPCHIPRQ